MSCALARPNQGTLSPEYHWHPPQEVRAPCSHAPAFTPLPNYLPGGCWRAAGATSIRAHARSTGQRCVTARGCSLGAPLPIPPGCPRPQRQAPALRGHPMPPWPPGRAVELPDIQVCISRRWWESCPGPLGFGSQQRAVVFVPQIFPFWFLVAGGRMPRVSQSRVRAHSGAWAHSTQLCACPVCCGVTQEHTWKLFFVGLAKKKVFLASASVLF